MKRKTRLRPDERRWGCCGDGKQFAKLGSHAPLFVGLANVRNGWEADIGTSSSRWQVEALAERAIWEHGVITNEEANRIAERWVEEFSVDPYVVRQRRMTAWHELDGLIHNYPDDALRVFERMAEKELINWTFEGLAVGPLRTFLMVHGARYNDELGAIRRRSAAFDEMHGFAVEGL